MDNPTLLIEKLRDLAAALSGVELPLVIPGAHEAKRSAREVAAQIDDHLLPRLESLDAPVLTVVGGSTGAGKSTLVNSLIGREVSPASVLRPTTTTPVLACNPADVGWFNSARILPGLPRLTGAPRQGLEGLYLVEDADIPAGIALLDAPDVDSVVRANRELATQLLGAADLWLFVTTAARYADAVPWSFLHSARRRNTAVALVLNRVPEEGLEEVPAHLRSMAEHEGLRETVVMTIPEVPLENGLIPSDALLPLRGWLASLAADAEARAALVRKTLEGSLAALQERIAPIASALQAQEAASKELAAAATDAYGLARERIEGGLTGGPLLRGEVLARWHEFIGTGDLMRNLQTTIGRWRDRVGDAVMGRPPVETEVRSAVESNIESVVIAACDQAAEMALSAWRATPHGKDLLMTREDVPSASSPELRDLIEAQVRAWQAHVLELVTAQGAGKRATGRALSFSLNAVGAALMVTVFAHTGGLTGGEVAIAGGTAALSQRLLEALFGDQAVRDLTEAARRDLLRRLEALTGAECARFVGVARAHSPREDEARTLTALATSVSEMAIP